MPKSYHEIEGRISKACSAYSDRENAKISELAREFDVPYYRLRNRITGRQSRTARPVRNKNLTDAQEAALHRWISLLDNWGSPPTAKMVERCANEILRRHGADHTVGKNWVYRFIKRLPFDLITQKPKASKRMEAENPGEISQWFDRLKQIIDCYQVQRQNIYNFDESGFQLGQGKDQKVVTAHRKRARHIGTGGHGETVTAIECIAADGWVMSPYIILKGLCQMESWYRDTNLPDDYRIAPQVNGWTSDAIAYDWLLFFHHCTKARALRGQYRLLLLDNHGSHITYEFIDFCDQNRIIAMPFPANMTHALQPLDQKPFLAYKHYYKSHNNSLLHGVGRLERRLISFVRSQLLGRILSRNGQSTMHLGILGYRHGIQTWF